MSEDRMSAHRFRWLAGLLAVVISLLVWQTVVLRHELTALHQEVAEAEGTAADAAEYGRQVRDNEREVLRR